MASEKSYSSFGLRVLALLDRRPMAELARSAGMSKTTLSSALTGPNPSAETVLAISQAIGRSVEYLMTGADGSSVPGVKESEVYYSRSGEPTDAIALPLVAELGGGPSEGQKVISMVTLPRAQLSRLPNLRSELWLVAMPDTTMGDLCAQGDLLVCQGPDGGMSERGVYVYKLNNIPTIRRVRRVETGGIQLVTDHPATEPIWAFMDGPDGTGAEVTVMARIAGAIRITPVT
ncbi:MAG: hypothetical protein DI568_08875 [Sphingomonas sp.]|nr:MAG: hypothetical protein DI568_08875 [Sphingomonas sp.]